MLCKKVKRIKHNYINPDENRDFFFTIKEKQNKMLEAKPLAVYKFSIVVKYLFGRDNSIESLIMAFV